MGKRQSSSHLDFQNRSSGMIRNGYEPKNSMKEPKTHLEQTKDEQPKSTTDSNKTFNWLPKDLRMSNDACVTSLLTKYLRFSCHSLCKGASKAEN